NRAVATRSSLVKAALARRHQNPTSAPPCENPPRHRNRAGATRSSLVKKRRSHADIKKAMSVPPCELPTAQKPCRGYPVIAGQEAATRRHQKAISATPLVNPHGTETRAV